MTSQPVITIIDYGLGNLYSVKGAAAHCGAEVVFADTPAGVQSAERLILPGVGAFGDGMRELRERGLVEPIREYARSGRPILGLCLGMQLLFEESEEFGRHEGLRLIAGQVIGIPPTGADGAPHRIPHVGWNDLVTSGGDDAGWEGSILSGVAAGSSVYFVHSFHAVPSNPANVLAKCIYSGRELTAAVRAGSVSGCQFHPERSGAVGLQIIRNFIEGSR